MSRSTVALSRDLQKKSKKSASAETAAPETVQCVERLRSAMVMAWSRSAFCYRIVGAFHHNAIILCQLEHEQCVAQAVPIPFRHLSLSTPTFNTAAVKRHATIKIIAAISSSPDRLLDNDQFPARKSEKKQQR